MSPVAYRPLQPTGGYIRLLNILPSKDTSTRLRCTLTEATLGNEPYEALSYTWGYPEPNKLIVLDDQGVKVIESLEAALRRLRLFNKVRTFWIDAICINQDDNEEKARQVALMDRIYTNATQVVVWLGEPDNDDRCAMMSLAVKNFSFSNNVRIWRAQRKHGLHKGLQGTYDAMSSGEADRGLGGLEPEIGQVAQLLDRPWWRRAWIVQEVILAKKVVVVCGPDEVPWENIKTRLGDHMYGLNSASGVRRPLRTYKGTVVDGTYKWPDAEHNILDMLQSARRSGKWHLTFYDLLYQFRRFQCTLPQDRIFSYLGLVNDQQSAGVGVDYSIPVSQLYSEVAKSLIAKHKHLLVLNCKREPWQDKVRYQQTRLFSIMDQGRFVDPKAMIVDEKKGKSREGWIRLPQGWERIVDSNGTWFYNHLTGTKQRNSPLQGQRFTRQTVEDFRFTPAGWHKAWDSLGRVKFAYQPSDDEAADKQASISLPSWVPNWNSYSVRDPEPLPLLSDAGSCYWASGKNRQVQLVPTSNPDSSILGVKGMLFDAIKTMAPAWCPEAEAMPISRNGVTTLEEWQRLAIAEPENCPYGGGMDRINAFWRTHLADYAGENAVPENDIAIFDAWCDRTGWTPSVADLEAQKVDSIFHVGKLMTETDAILKMASDVHAALIDPETGLDLGLSGVPKFVYQSLKDSFANMSYIKKRYKEIRSRIYRASANRAMFVTSKGFIGLGPWNAKEGDSVVVLLGGCTPFILRPTNHMFTLVGEAYVYGIMGGEVFGGEMRHARLRDFEII